MANNDIPTIDPNDPSSQLRIIRRLGKQALSRQKKDQKQASPATSSPSLPEKSTQPNKPEFIAAPDGDKDVPPVPVKEYKILTEEEAQKALSTLLDPKSPPPTMIQIHRARRDLELAQLYTSSPEEARRQAVSELERE